MIDYYTFYSSFNLLRIINDKLLEESISSNSKKILFYKYLYILHIILYYKENYKIDKSFEGVRIHSDILSDVLGVSNSSKLLKNLRNWKLISITKKFELKKYSNHYDIHEQFNSDPIYELEVPRSDYPDFIDKLNNKLTENSTGITSKLHKILIENITLNNLGTKYLNKKYPNGPEQSLLKDVAKINNITLNGLVTLTGARKVNPDQKLINISNKKFHRTLRPVPGSRIYSTLTSLKREHRKFLNFNGKPMLMTDISCSQVLLSVEVILKNYSITSGCGRNDIPPDIIRYKKLAEEGLFYEFISMFSDYNLSISEDRYKFKKQFFIDIFFSKVTNWSTEIKDNFESIFPTVTKIINNIKSDDHGEFAVQLQKFEANIVIDKVTKKLLSEGRKVLTLHDAIIASEEEDLRRAEELLTKELQKLKTPLYPNFKRDQELSVNQLYLNPEYSVFVDILGNKFKIRNFVEFVRDLGDIPEMMFKGLILRLGMWWHGNHLIPIKDSDYEFSSQREDDYVSITYHPNLEMEN